MGANLILNTSKTATIVNGTATILIGPLYAREQWNINATTVTALGMTITVSLNGQIVDSSVQDPRPTATDNTPFQLMSGNQLKIVWTNGTNGQGVTVTVTGTRKVGGDVVHP